MHILNFGCDVEENAMPKMQLTQDQYDTILVRLLTLEDPKLTHPCTKEVDIKVISETVERIEAGVSDIRKAVFGNGNIGLAETARKNAAAIVDLQSDMKLKMTRSRSAPPAKVTGWMWFRDKVLGSLVVGILLFIIITFIPDLMVLMATHK
jgi:hypothetical protein